MNEFNSNLLQTLIADMGPGLVLGDEHELVQLQRMQVNSAEFTSGAHQMANEIETGSVTVHTATRFLKESLRLYQRHVTDCRRELLSSLFSFGYKSTFDMVQRFERCNFNFEFEVPPGAYSALNRQSMGSYQTLYADDVTVSSVTSALSNAGARLPAPNWNAQPKRTMDMSEITRNTLQNCSDRINLRRIELSERHCEEFLLNNSSVSVEMVDAFVAQHSKLVKLMYLYKTMVLPNANLGELQHIQYLQVLFLKDLCGLFPDGLCASLWYKATHQPVPVTARFAEFQQQTQSQVIELKGLPDACVYLPVRATAPPESLPEYAEELPAEVAHAQATLERYHFLMSVKCILEHKFASFNSGNTRVCNNLGRSAKLQVCGYAAAVRQMTQATRPLPVVLSDGVSCQLLVHMEPQEGSQNEFRCLCRSQTERMYVVQTLLALFVDTRILHAWLRGHEERILAAKRAAAPANTRSTGRTGAREGRSVGTAGRAVTSSGLVDDQIVDSLSDISEAGDMDIWEEVT